MVERLLIKNGTLVTINAKIGIIKGGALLIEGNEIKDVGKTSELLKEYGTEETIDASGKVVMPGLINAYHHLYSTFARGMPISGEAPRNFEEILEKVWRKLDRSLTGEGIYYSALVPLIESVKSGTTTVIDHHESQSYQRDALDELAKAIEEVGVRASLCLGTSDRYGRGEEGIEENRRFLSKLDSR